MGLLSLVNNYLKKKHTLTEKKLIIFLTIVTFMSLMLILYQLPSSSLTISEESQNLIFPENKKIQSKLKATQKAAKHNDLKKQVFKEIDTQEAKLNKHRRNRIKEVSFVLIINKK
jgi:hypothetical protein